MILKMLVAVAGLLLSCGAIANACPDARPGDRVAMPTAPAALAKGKALLAQQYKPDFIAKFEPFAAELKSGIWEISGRMPETDKGRPLKMSATICRATGIALSVDLR